MDLEQMKYYKKLHGYTMAQLSEHSGVPLGTLQKIFNGETKNPRYDTLKAIEKVLRPEESNIICEALTEYGVKEGAYTLEDYYALPDERRVELIDGTFYDLAAPSVSHQAVSARLGHMIYDHIEKKKGECMVFQAPVDVQLDCDNKTMVQPDVIVVCDRDRISDRCIMGAPDFVIEILSPSTMKKDGTLKLHKYANAGVREYWMIDIKRKKVITHFFEEDDVVPCLYGFDSEIPVRIFGGELKIDFRQMQDVLGMIGS